MYQHVTKPGRWHNCTTKYTIIIKFLTVCIWNKPTLVSLTVLFIKSVSLMATMTWNILWPR